MKPSIAQVFVRDEMTKGEQLFEHKPSVNNSYVLGASVLAWDNHFEESSSPQATFTDKKTNAAKTSIPDSELCKIKYFINLLGDLFHGIQDKPRLGSLDVEHFPTYTEDIDVIVRVLWKKRKIRPDFPRWCKTPWPPTMTMVSSFESMLRARRVLQYDMQKAK